MQEVFDNIIKLLTQKENEAVLKAQNTGDIANAEYQKWMMKSYGFKEAIEIVKQEAEKYNNGWIPCSEKLPELRQDVLVTVKYTGFMGMHGYWIKTGHMEAENDWWGDCAGGEVIAWQPLPKPYKESD